MITLLISIGLLLVGFFSGFYMNDNVTATLQSLLLKNAVLWSFVSLIAGWSFRVYFDRRKTQEEQKKTLSLIISSLDDSFSCIKKIYNHILDNLRKGQAPTFSNAELPLHIEKSDLLKFDEESLNKKYFFQYMSLIKDLNNTINQMRELNISPTKFGCDFCDVLAAFYKVNIGFDSNIGECFKKGIQFSASYSKNTTEISYRQNIENSVKTWHHKSPDYKNIKLGELHFTLNNIFYSLQLSLKEMIKSIENSKIKTDAKLVNTLKEKYAEFIKNSNSAFLSNIAR
ncbi:MAG: hypothetical protein FWF00_03170 [Endomicrobia bacterium]|nr:hypothetical protein [Endomicrobiia bacterium]MCL2506677.1 hypothetical protein [Endomicrobiia bacterium]